MSGWKTRLLRRLPAVALLAATLLFWNRYERYESAGPPLLHRPALADAARVRGDCSEADGRFTLRVPEGGRTASANFRLPGASDHRRIRVQARMRLEDVVPGRYSWSCARLLLLQYGADGKWMPGRHGVVAEQGTKDWAAYTEVFEVDPAAAQVEVGIQQGGRSGTAEFADLFAEPVRTRPSHPRWRIFFSILWVAAALPWLRAFRPGRRLRLLILLNTLAILAGTLMPAKWIQDSTERLKATAARTVERPADRPAARRDSGAPDSPPRAAEADAARIDQFNALVGGAHRIGHFLLFASLCFLACCSAALERRPTAAFFKAVGDLLLFAAISESLQHLTADRTASFGDWLTDAYGMAAAFVPFLAGLGIRRAFVRRRGATGGAPARG